MTNTYHAQPYDISKSGFYFTDLASYQKGVEASGAEEFELQFIDGSKEDAQLFSACEINQATLEQWFDEVEPLADSEKVALFYLCAHTGYELSEAIERFDDVAIYHGHLIDAASELFDDCYLSEVPEHIRAYIDYEKFARDCDYGGDMCEFEFAGETYTCTNSNCI